MFSPMIQNLMASSGQSSAVKRYNQLQNLVSYANKVDSPDKSEQIASFQKVLNQTATEGIKSTPLADKFSNVKAKLISNTQATNAPKIENISALNSSTSNKANKSQILAMVEKIAKKHGVDDKLVKAVIKQESGFNPNAKSHCGAMGLMQLMPATAKGLGVVDAFNPVQNVEGGVKYLKSMLNKYNGNVILALAAYNAGPGAVDKYDGVPPYGETQNYVKSILANYL